MKHLLGTVKQTDIFIQPEQHESGDRFILTFLHFCISLSTGYSVGKQITCRVGLNARQNDPIRLYYGASVNNSTLLMLTPYMLCFFLTQPSLPYNVREF